MYDKKLRQSGETRQIIIEKLINRLGEKKAEIRAHARRVQKLAVELGRKIKLSSSELSKLAQAAFLHDIGLIAVSEDIIKELEKMANANYFQGEKGLDLPELEAQTLEQNEWEEIKKHPEVGYRIVRSSDRFSHLAEPILYHHERWDGGGYPRQLKGQDIPLLSRVIHLVDAYDVLEKGRGCDRVDKESIKTIIKDGAGEFFDPELVDEFLKIV